MHKLQRDGRALTHNKVFTSTCLGYSNGDATRLDIEVSG